MGARLALDSLLLLAWQPAPMVLLAAAAPSAIHLGSTLPACVLSPAHLLRVLQPAQLLELLEQLGQPVHVAQAYPQAVLLQRQLLLPLHLDAVLRSG